MLITISGNTNEPEKISLICDCIEIVLESKADVSTSLKSMNSFELQDALSDVKNIVNFRK